MEISSRMFIYTLIIVGVVCLHHAGGDFHAPCYGCRMFNIAHREHPEMTPRKSSLCSYPCQCPVVEVECIKGVNRIKDGCSCCYMCGRQRGDICNTKDICDFHKGLYCQNKTHTCQAKVKKPCTVDGKTYKDGEQFQPDCRRLCTCQNGYYGCASRCPQEETKPSLKNCRNPTLLPVPGKCCKEWTCDKLEDLPYRDSAMESQNLVMYRPFYTKVTTPKPKVMKSKCHMKSTGWTPCSATCDVGVSVRVVADLHHCKAIQETRLCFLRPCGDDVYTLGREKCTPTTRSGEQHRIIYQDCRSVKEYSMKFCTNCRKDKCCYPQLSRTRFIEFECSAGRREIMNVMWIKKCACDKTCYVPNKKKRKRKRRLSYRKFANRR